MKPTSDGPKPKARLVARGFEEQTDNIETESPTCSKDTLREMISVISQNNWELKSIDILISFDLGHI